MSLFCCPLRLSHFHRVFLLKRGNISERNTCVLSGISKRNIRVPPGTEKVKTILSASDCGATRDTKKRLHSALDPNILMWFGKHPSLMMLLMRDSGELIKVTPIFNIFIEVEKSCSAHISKTEQCMLCK